MTSSIKPKRNSEFSARLLPDGYVLIHSESSEWVHTLTPLGGLVWEFCDGDKTAEEIASLICSAAQVPANEEEVLHLVKDFEEKGLLSATGT